MRSSISTTRTILLALSLGAAATACGGSDDSGGGGDGDGAGSPDGGGGGEDFVLDPPADGEGFQITNVGTTIDPGEDIEYCEVMQLPGSPSDTYYVKAFESVMTSGSHHLIVAAVEPGSTTDGNATVGDRVECFGPAGGFGGDLLDVTGQQVPHHQEQFPDGVGRVYTGGQKLIFNYHYLNASEADLQAQAKVNFYTTDEAHVQKIAESAGFFFVGIDVDDGQTASYDVDCTFSEDVMVYKLTRHTHKWGTDFPVYYSGGPNDGDLIYTSPNYENPDYIFDAPIQVAAGNGFKFTCNYENDSGHHLGFGENTTDEMCILFPIIYSPTAREVTNSQGCLRTN